MSIINTGELPDQVAKMMAAESAGECQVTFILPSDSSYFKVQDGEYNGNGAYFNQQSNTRFSLLDKSKGVIYFSRTLPTSLKEVFQDEEVIGTKDLHKNFIAVLKPTRELRLFDEKQLASWLGVKVGDLMMPKAVYADTQYLAQVLSPYADGMQYLSRHTGEACIVLWSDLVDGGGCLETVSVTSLAQYQHNGKSIKEILKFHLNVLVTP
jgi:hypothetical protein